MPSGVNMDENKYYDLGSSSNAAFLPKMEIETIKIGTGLNFFWPGSTEWVHVIFFFISFYLS